MRENIINISYIYYKVKLQDAATGSWIAEIDISLRLNNTKYEATYLMARAGATVSCKGHFSLDVVCGPKSALIVSSTFDQEQKAQVGQDTAFFAFSEFSSLSDCLPIIYKVRWVTLNFTSIPVVENQIIPNSEGTLKAFPPDTNSLGSYEFEIYVEGEGGNSIVT